MAAETVKTLVGEETKVLYETKFDKTRKDFDFYFLFIIPGIIVFSAIIGGPLATILLSIPLLIIYILNKITLTDIQKSYPKVGVYEQPNKEYFIHLGDAVTSIKEVIDPSDVAKNPQKYASKKLFPVLMDHKMFLTHMFVAGATGSGKTTFLSTILRQAILLGAGSLTVDGKGDQSVYEAFYNTAVHSGREDDFMVMNFGTPTESNTMNPLLLDGNADEVSDIISGLLDSGGDNAFWANRGKTFMLALLSIMIPLRDANLLFLPNGQHVEVLTFSLLSKYFDVPSLRKLYFVIKKSAIPNKDGTYNIKEVEIPESLKYTYKPVDFERLEDYLKSIYVSTTDEAAEINPDSDKQQGNSVMMWSAPFSLLAGRYGPIFNTANPEILMNDIVSNCRILYILLPATKVDPLTLKSLGKLILSFFKNSVSILLGDKISGTIEQRYRSFAIRPRVPFVAFMDEYGSYAVEGFDNVLAQARSLKISIIILVQEKASLEKAGKEDSLRILGNTTIKVVLKLEEQETIQAIAEFFGKKEKAVIKQTTVDGKSKDKSIEIKEDYLITPNMLREMQPGHGYVLFGGEAVPFLVNYYEPPISKKIAEFKDTINTYVGNFKILFFIDEIKPKQETEIIDNEMAPIAVNINDELSKLNIQGLDIKKLKELTFLDINFNTLENDLQNIGLAIDTLNKETRSL